MGEERSVLNDNKNTEKTDLCDFLENLLNVLVGFRRHLMPQPNAQVNGTILQP